MNIREKVRFCVDDAMNTATGYAQGQESVESERAALERATDRIIALVTAARDAEIREALLSDGAVERAASAIHRVDVSMFPDSVRHIPARTVYRDRASAALQAAVEPEPDAIERAAKAIAEMYPPRDNKHDGYVKPVWDMADIEDLAEHALKAAGDDLDAMLDSVHPRAIIRSVWALRGGGWEARISVPEGPDDDGWYDYTGNQGVGTGATRYEAIADAVSRAKEGR